MKKFLILALCLIISTCIIGCEDIEDTNGSDTALTTISMEKLSGSSISGSSKSVSTSTSQTRTTITTDHDDIDYDTFIRKGGPSSGIFTLTATGLNKNQKLTITCNSTIESGNIGLILITDDNEIVYEFKTNKKDEFSITASDSEKYLVRLGCESYVGTIELKRSIN